MLFQVPFLPVFAILVLALVAMCLLAFQIARQNHVDSSLKIPGFHFQVKGGKDKDAD